MKLLHLYPAAWRARYGDELAALVEELDRDGRMSWRAQFDIVRRGLVERLRALGLRGLPPDEREREGSLLVLYAWTLFVLGGVGVQKTSEHWQAATPLGRQGLPSTAFDVLVAAAGVGSALVLLGVAASRQQLASFVRGGGWGEIRGPIVRAAVLTVVAAAMTAGLASWAHSLTPAARNGADHVYSGAFLAWAVFCAGCLFAWAAAAASTARRLSLPPAPLRLEARLAVAVSATMVVVTIATAVCWGSVASAAPWFLAGRPIGSNASPLVANIAVSTA
jgi:hypothetical protein